LYHNILRRTKMKSRFFAVLMVLSLVMALVGVTSPAMAAAYGTSFTTSVTYQNVGTGDANITMTFYSEGSATGVPINLPLLAANAGSSVFVGSLTVPSGNGSAVISSDQPLVATAVQVPPSTSAVKSRPLSNSFSGGTTKVLVPTVLKNMFGYTSIVSIQNVDSVGADLTVEFVPTGGSIFTVTVPNLPSGASKYYDMGSFVNANLGATFNGSMRVTAVQTGTATAGAIVATAVELGTSANKAYAWEGANQTGTTLYMPSAFCRYTASTYASTYAVQNVGTSPIDITVTYSNSNSESYTGVAGGAKVSIPGCGKTGTLNPDGFIGSATITATGQIAGIAKISTTTGLITAFLGFTDGAAKIGMPFVRWTQAQWVPGGRSRAVLAIQNLGTPLTAGQAVVKYFDKNGAQVGSQALPAIATGGKANSNPFDAGAGNEFGYYSDGTFGGSATVEGPAGSKLVAIVRISTNTGGTSIDGEDYNGVPIP
jgi:hypothetical protein